MYVYIYMNMYIYALYIYIYRYMCVCVRDGYGRACGCIVPDAHVRAIARADDAAVAITCARGYVRLYKYSTHTSCTSMYISIDAKSGEVNGYA